MSTRVEPEFHLLAAVITGKASVVADHLVGKAKAAGKVLVTVQLQPGTEDMIKRLVNDGAHLDNTLDSVIQNLVSLTNQSFKTGIYGNPKELDKSRHYRAAVTELASRTERDIEMTKKEIDAVQRNEELRQLRIKEELTRQGVKFSAETFDAYVRRIKELGAATVDAAAEEIQKQDKEKFDTFLEEVKDESR